MHGEREFSGGEVGQPGEQWRVYHSVPTDTDTDPGMGVVRHADAGYEEAIEEAEESNVAVPMRDRE